MLFADDLLVFYKGDTASVQLVRDQLERFSATSGLMVNEEKSIVYLAGVSVEDMKKIGQVLKMPIGGFHFRYLGVPLTHKKLTIAQCLPLVDKITSKIHHWPCRALTFAARLVLIKSVLFSMKSFWSKVFLIPKKVIKRIEILCRVFLWSEPDGHSKKTYVACDFLCQEKLCGGLGVKDFIAWNQAVVLKQLRSIEHKKIACG